MKTKANPASLRPSQLGLTLVELMVAITIGLLILAAVVAVFQANSQNYRQNEAIAQLQDNARFALDVLSRDLTMAGYWGGIRSLETSQLLQVSAAAAAAVGTAVLPGDCGPATPAAPPLQPWLFQTDKPVEFLNHKAGAAAVAASFRCLTYWQTDTDILVIRRVAGQSAAVLTAGATVILTPGRFYLKTNQSGGSIFHYSAATPAVAMNIAAPIDCTDPASGTVNVCPPSDLPIQYYAYLPRIYYVRNYYKTVGDGIPTLCRRELQNDAGGVPGMQDEALAPGVENLQVEWGIDTNGDQLVDQYLADPTAVQLQDVYTARVSILVRATAINTAFSGGNKTFTLGDWGPVTLGGALRRSFSTTVQLKNLR